MAAQQMPPSVAVPSRPSLAIPAAQPVAKRPSRATARTTRGKKIDYNALAGPEEEDTDEEDLLPARSPEEEKRARKRSSRSDRSRAPKPPAEFQHIKPPAEFQHIDKKPYRSEGFDEPGFYSEKKPQVEERPATNDGALARSSCRGESKPHAQHRERYKSEPGDRHRYNKYESALPGGYSSDVEDFDSNLRKTEDEQSDDESEEPLAQYDDWEEH